MATEQEQGPDPPDSLPEYLREGTEKQDVATLRDLAEWAEQLADYREAETERELQERADQDASEIPDEWDEDDWQDALEEARGDDDVPAAKGTIVVKTIDGNGYYYLQWRDGEKIKSKYVAPVSPSD